MGRLQKGVKIGKARSSYKQLMARYITCLGEEHITR
jgi:hypothetical protein